MTDAKSLEKIKKCLEEYRLDEAAGLLTEEISRVGFNDELAILGASINGAYGDGEGYLSMVTKGLEYNPKNYELHLMLGNWHDGVELESAYREYSFARAYCLDEKGEDDRDFEYIDGVLNGFKYNFEPEIEEFEKNLPILIYKSDTICYGVLNRFADRLAQELSALGERVEIIDVNEVPPESIVDLTGNFYKAVLGIQTYLFSMHFQDGRNIHDYIFGPKFNILFDHPCCMYNHFTKGPKDYTILTHDRNYLEFIKNYYPQIKDVGLLAPGGDSVKCLCNPDNAKDFKVSQNISDNAEPLKQDTNRKYGLSFVGTYKSPDTWEGVLSELDSVYEGRATKLTDYIMHHPNETYEACLIKVFTDDGIDVESEPNDSAKIFFDLKQTYFKVMSYYREQILLTLLNAGIEIHVFGESFNTPLFKPYSNLIVHKELTPEESLEVYADSKLSLNIMSWHKDGRTERVANAMFNGSVVVTDSCRYLSENYVDGEDIVLFDLADFSGLAERIKELLANEDKRRQMAFCAYEKAVKNDSWSVRSREFLDLLSQ